ncbi:carbonic anhydrase family protein [Chitinophaga qingshengii]|uniref:carbonic anhydrase n=1 Tax=Chitinophaga qingshengii TaxID=1569794 RepID=A0ABR7THK8_9BACT|nr:carbonic anhydrase family protein [Chitinophaga qingshengii]MBC9929008.1 carbonic anhydrase [Chitinophaga qingshengii]
MYKHSKESQSTLTPEMALQYLKEGNSRFVNNLRANRDLLSQVNATRDGQYPFATVLSCMDSRTSVELIFDQGLGDIFSIRIAGNVLNQDILGSMEFGTQLAGSKIIVVLGHTQCGAIKGACDGVHLGSLTQLLDKIRPAIDRETSTPAENRTGKNAGFVKNVTENNVHHVIEQLKAESPVIAALADSGAIKIVGGIYHLETGAVTFFEE